MNPTSFPAEYSTPPEYHGNWARLESYGIFVVDGMGYCGLKLVSIVLACIGDGHYRVILRRDGLLFKSKPDGGNYHEVIDEFELLAHKFDRLYPMHFLAKEWPKEVPWRMT